MINTQSLLLVLFIAAVVGIFVWIWFHFKQASNIAQEIFPVWAAQGPFETGQQSAAAMRYAYLAVRGPEETEQMAEAITKHGQIYDADPATWEKLRQDAENQSDAKIEEYVSLAKGFAAMDLLNEDFVRGGGQN